MSSSNNFPFDMKSKPETKERKMALHQKRNAYTAQLDNAESIGANQTIVPALVKNVTEGKTNKGTSYFRISAICMAKGDVFVKMRPPKSDKKQKTDDENGASVVDTVVDPEDQDATNTPKGTTIKPGEQFMATAYDRTAGSLDQGMLVKLAVTTDWYIDHYTFQTSKVMVDDRNSNVLTRRVYDTCVVDTAMAHIPTKFNFSPDDFPEDTDEKYITRSFIAPLSMGVGGKLFSNVEIQLDPHDKSRFYNRKRDDPVHYIGVNFDIGGDNPANMMKVVYTLNDENNTKILMSYAYMPEVWQCFGITNLDQWKEIAGRLIFYAVDWLVYGYSQYHKIMAIKANMDGGDDMFDDDSSNNEEFQYSTGFVTKMAVDVANTVRGCGIPLSFDYVNANYGPESDYENDIEISNHPINHGWKVLLKRNKPFVLNLTDMTGDQVSAFIKEYKKLENNNIKFFGIYSVDSDVPYEIQAEDDLARENQLVEGGFKPVSVFAVNN